MKKMITNKIIFKEVLYTKWYQNGQLAVFIQNENEEPIAELSIMDNSIELASNEFILKDYSENKDLAEKCVKNNLFVSTNRFILIGSHLCPICKIYSEC